MSMELKQIEPKEAVSASKFPLLDRRGGCAIKKKAAFLAGADGVVDQAPKSKRSAARALTYLPPRRSRSKTIARVFPSCPGGEICSPVRFPWAGRMSPLRGCIALLALCFVLAAPAARAQPVNVIVQIDLDDVIHPVSADYVKQGLEHAKQIGARAAIIRINTPGGLVDSMREIVEAILSAQVPVITWVGPNGSRAASAGFFILLAADVTLMAPGTNTGAAHPVSITGSKIDDVMEKKIVSDASAYLRSYVAKRGRNAALAEKGVSESQSFTAEEALSEHLIDGVVNDIPSIVQQYDGKEIKRFNDETVRLALKDASIQTSEMTARQRLLSNVLNPNVALILMLVGLICLYVEMTHPGLILPGVVGAISMVLALFAFNLLPVNWTGALLILVAITLFVLEATVTSHGVLALGGCVAMIFGGLMLVEGPIPQLRIHL